MKMTARKIMNHAKSCFLIRSATVITAVGYKNKTGSIAQRKLYSNQYCIALLYNIKVSKMLQCTNLAVIHLLYQTNNAVGTELYTKHIRAVSNIFWKGRNAITSTRDKQWVAI